jgi:hypothetical protein
MAKRIIAITNDSGGGGGRVYLSNADLPGSLAVSLNETDKVYERCTINAFSPDKLFVAGQGRLNRSVDAGATWAVTTYGYISTDVVRSLQCPVSGTLVLATNTALYLSTDDGATLSGITIPTGGTSLMDAHFWDGQVGYALKNNVAGGGLLAYTTDGGTTWTTFDLSTMPGWESSEAPRRCWAFNADGATANVVFILTSHKLWRITHAHVAVTDPTATSVAWDYLPVVSPLFSVFPQSGYDGSGNDVNSLFDFLCLKGDRTWIGGHHCLRAHRFGTSAFVLSDAAAFDPTVNFYTTHSAFDINEVFVGSSEPGYVLPPKKPGLYRSLNGGVSTSLFQGFTNKESLADHALYAGSEVTGCTDPDACNYLEAATVDDGSCQNAVQLVDCSDSTVVHANTPAISALACRNPAFVIYPKVMDPDTGSQALNILLDGVVVIGYTATVPVTGTPQERLQQFIGGLVYFINSTTTYSATIIPAADNPFDAGFFGAVRITVPAASQAGAAVSQVNIGLLGVALDAMVDNGSAGSVVMVAEYPGRCFRVCGEGNCAIALPLTLQAAYPNCSSCLPSLPQSICLDCAAQVSIGDMPLYANGPGASTCVSAGDTLDLHISASFGEQAGETLVPIEAGNLLGIGCPAVLTFHGDQTAFFPEGSSVFFSDGNGQYPVVLSRTYDQDADLTTVVFAGNYLGGDALTSVSVFTQCDSSVRVVLESVTGTGDLSFASLYDTTFNSVAGVVEAVATVPIPDYGRYRLTVIASDCTGSKSCTYWLGACGGLQVQETDCHSWSVQLVRPEGAFPTGSLFHVKIQDLFDGTVKAEADVPDTAFPFSLLGSSDTVYLVTVTLPDQVVVSTEIIDTCSLLKCQAQLVQEIICSDPCIADETSAQVKEARLELSRMSVLAQEVRRIVYDTRYQALGIPEMTSRHLTNLQGLARMIGAIRKLSERCADCHKPSNPCGPCQD